MAWRLARGCSCLRLRCQRPPWRPALAAALALLLLLLPRRALALLLLLLPRRALALARP